VVGMTGMIEGRRRAHVGCRGGRVPDIILNSLDFSVCFVVLHARDILMGQSRGLPATDLGSGAVVEARLLRSRRGDRDGAAAGGISGARRGTTRGCGRPRDAGSDAGSSCCLDGLGDLGVGAARACALDVNLVLLLKEGSIEVRALRQGKSATLFDA